MAKPRVALDTNILIATVCPWHEHHSVTFRCLQRSHESKTSILIPRHALLEAYSVLTRLPGSQRLAPRTAADALRLAFSNCELISMPPVDWLEINSLAASDVRGGRVYDAVIAEAAARAKADTLLTWNTADFSGIGPSGLAIRTPS